MDKRYISENVGKIVLTTEGDILGVIKNTLLSSGYKKEVGAIAFEQESGEEFAFSAANVFREGAHAVILREPPTPPAGGYVVSPVGLSAFSLCGTSLGAVADLAVEDGRVTAFVTQAGEYPLNRVVAVKQSVLIDIATPRLRLPGARKKQEEGNADAAPVPAQCGERLLLGRKVKRDIFSQKGERIAREGEIITRETLAEVKKYGKLYELTVGSLSNIL